MSLELARPLELELEGIVLERGPDRLLDGVGLAVEQGAWYGILDADGRAGQPLFDVVTGVLRPGRGRILLAGAPVTHLAARERVRLGIARSFSASPPSGPATIGDMLVHAMRFARHDATRLLLGGPPRPVERRTAGEMLGLFELEGMLDHPLAGLPVYYRQCIEIARLLVTGCRVLLLDRPFRGLQAAERERLAGVLAGRLRPRELTVLLLDDDTRQLAALCGRIAVLHRGRVLAEDAPERIGTRLDVMRALVG